MTFVIPGITFVSALLVVYALQQVVFVYFVPTERHAEIFKQTAVHKSSKLLACFIYKPRMKQHENQRNSILK